MLEKNSPAALQQEEQQLAWLRQFTSLVAARLRTEKFSEEEAVCFLEEVKQQILTRFPDKATAYALIYERRFKRILQKRGICLPFDVPGATSSLT